MGMEWETRLDSCGSYFRCSMLSAGSDLVPKEQVHGVRPKRARNLPLQKHRRRLVLFGDLRGV